MGALRGVRCMPGRDIDAMHGAFPAAWPPVARPRSRTSVHLPQGVPEATEPTSVAGLWDLDIVVNEATSITGARTCRTTPRRGPFRARRPRAYGRS